MTDILQFVSIPKTVGLAHIRDLYLKNGFTASQIAECVGLSKAAVLVRLHQIGIRKSANKGTENNNYRFTQKVPFGTRLVDGKLLDNRKELKIVRQIVNLRQYERLSWNAIAVKLNDAGRRTKKGRTWKVETVKRVFIRWTGKC